LRNIGAAVGKSQVENLHGRRVGFVKEKTVSTGRQQPAGAAAQGKMSG
jgi:hypothetical protein